LAFRGVNRARPEDQEPDACVGAISPSCALKFLRIPSTAKKIALPSGGLLLHGISGTPALGSRTARLTLKYFNVSAMKL
jgi:hypothetical protein